MFKKERRNLCGTERQMRLLLLGRTTESRSITVTFILDRTHSHRVEPQSLGSTRLALLLGGFETVVVRAVQSSNFGSYSLYLHPYAVIPLEFSRSTPCSAL